MWGRLDGHFPAAFASCFRRFSSKRHFAPISSAGRISNSCCWIRKSIPQTNSSHGRNRPNALSASARHCRHLSSIARPGRPTPRVPRGLRSALGQTRSRTEGSAGWTTSERPAVTDAFPQPGGPLRYRRSYLSDVAVNATVIPHGQFDPDETPIRRWSAPFSAWLLDRC